MKYIDDFYKRISRYEAFWQGEFTDRCLMSVIAPKTKTSKFEDVPTCDERDIYDFWTNPQRVVKRYRHIIENSYYAGDALPIMNFNLGACSHAGFFKGAKWVYDPSLFHDDDRKYFVNMEWDYRKYEEGSENKQFSGILLTELDPVTLKPISEPVKIYKGTDRELVEAPHIYKKDGYYYLFTAEGGTEYTHTQTVARSKELYGEYENHPNLYLICAKEAYKQIAQSKLQKTGHGSITQAKDGRWWFAFLCGRPLDGTEYCPLGRETSINEIVWENDWPYLKNKTQVADVEFEGYGEKEPTQRVNYDFNSEEFRLDFQTPRTSPKYEVQNGVLRLYGGDSPVSNFSQGMMVRRQTEFSFEVEASLTLHGKNFQQMAGLVYRYDERTHYYLRVSRNDDGKPTLGILCMDAWNFSMPISEIALEEGKVHMKLCVDKHTGKFSYSTDGTNYKEIPYIVDVTTLSDDYGDPLGFTGAYVGVLSVDMCDKTSWADYHSFSYTPK